MSWVITAVVVGATVAAGTATSIYSSVKAQEQARDDARELRRKQATATKETAFRLQKRRGIIGREPGPRETILTGPGGLGTTTGSTGATGGGVKTLLGT